MTSTLSTLALMLMLQAPDDVQELLESPAYKVTWNEPDTLDSQTILEVGTGSGHGLSMHWLRFQPGEVHVEVLSITYQEERTPYQSKWPPDNVPIKVKRAVITKAAYATLLTKISWLKAAKLVPNKSEPETRSSNDFWVSVHATWKTVPVLDQDWAGYNSSTDEPLFAVPRAIGVLAAKAIKSANSKPYELTAADRTWASARFNRDWKRFATKDDHWWVRERYLVTIGVVGDATVLPTLTKLLQAPIPKGSSESRCIYHAINAATRLIKKDVRPKPVENMNLDQAKSKVLELLPK